MAQQTRRNTSRPAPQSTPFREALNVDRSGSSRVVSAYERLLQWVAEDERHAISVAANDTRFPGALCVRFLGGKKEFTAIIRSPFEDIEKVLSTASQQF